VGTGAFVILVRQVSNKEIAQYAELRYNRLLKRLIHEEGKTKLHIYISVYLSKV